MFSDEELSTILAALRHWQESVKYNDRQSYPHFLDVCPLDDYGIDCLCEKIAYEI